MTHEAHPIGLLVSGLATIVMSLHLGQMTEFKLITDIMNLGGPLVGIVLMWFGLRYMKAEKEKGDKKNEALTQQLLDSDKKSTEARLVLANAITTFTDTAKSNHTAISDKLDHINTTLTDKQL